MKKIIETVAEGGGELGVHMYPFTPKTLDNLSFALLVACWLLQHVCLNPSRAVTPRQASCFPLSVRCSLGQSHCFLASVSFFSPLLNKLSV